MEPKLNANIIKRAIRAPFDYYNRFMLRQSFRSQTADSRGPNERTVEYPFALKALSFSHYQDILDVGSGLSPWPATLAACGYHVTAIDEMTTYWNESIINKHFHVIHGDITAPQLNKTFGIVTCISTLEHIPKHAEAMRCMVSLMKDDGILILSFPYNEHRYLHNIYDHPNAGYGHGSGFITQIYDRQTINGWLSANNLESIDQKYFQCFSGELWSFGQRRFPMKEVRVDESHHLTCLVMKKARY
jgi:SAM-dependent methyltransferase